MNFINSFLIYLVVLVQFFVLVRSDREQDECGKIDPLVKRYIYGGRASRIENWPWQVC
jgi:hypothetical protein